jgi:hypothetical protein
VDIFSAGASQDSPQCLATSNGHCNETSCLTSYSPINAKNMTTTPSGGGARSTKLSTASNNIEMSELCRSVNSSSTFSFDKLFWVTSEGLFSFVVRGLYPLVQEIAFFKGK